MGGLVRGGAWRREVIRDGRGRGGGGCLGKITLSWLHSA